MVQRDGAGRMTVRRSQPLQALLAAAAANEAVHAGGCRPDAADAAAAEPQLLPFSGPLVRLTPVLPPLPTVPLRAPPLCVNGCAHACMHAFLLFCVSAAVHLRDQKCPACFNASACGLLLMHCAGSTPCKHTRARDYRQDSRSVPDDSACMCYRVAQRAAGPAPAAMSLAVAVTAAAAATSTAAGVPD